MWLLISVIIKSSNWKSPMRVNYYSFKTPLHYLQQLCWTIVLMMMTKGAIMRVLICSWLQLAKWMGVVFCQDLHLFFRSDISTTSLKKIGIGCYSFYLNFRLVTMKLRLHCFRKKNHILSLKCIHTYVLNANVYCHI